MNSPTLSAQQLQERAAIAEAGEWFNPARHQRQNVYAVRGDDGHVMEVVAADALALPDHSQYLRTLIVPLTLNQLREALDYEENQGTKGGRR